MNPIQFNNVMSAAPSAIQRAAGGSSTSSASGSASQSTPEDSIHLSLAAMREVSQAGRIAIQTERGKLSSSQSSELQSQEQQMYNLIVADKQANGGALTTSEKESINQSQTQLSHEIYADAHGLDVSSPITTATPPSTASAS